MHLVNLNGLTETVGEEGLRVLQVKLFDKGLQIGARIGKQELANPVAELRSALWPATRVTALAFGKLASFSPDSRGLFYFPLWCIPIRVKANRALFPVLPLSCL